MLTEWERFAHNYQVFKDAIINSRLHVPPGKYLLVDAEYYNIDFAFTPYCGVYYHLKKQAAANL